MKKHTFKLLIGLVTLLIINIDSVSAQCNQFAKKTCLPELKEFTHNGQLNIQQLAPGEQADLELTFYSGMNYRLLVCGQEVLGKLAFQVMDAKNNVIFNNKDHNDATSWDFEVQSTQQMTVIVTVPKGKKPANDITASGCATVLVGFKQ